MNPREQAVDFYNKAIQVLPSDAAHAYRLFTSSVMVDPSFPEGWITVSNANGDMNLLPACVAAARQAVSLAPDNIAAVVNLGHRLYHRGMNAEARIYTERALEMQPDHPFALVNLSIIELADNNTERSYELAKQAFELDKQPITEFALAIACLNSERWQEGFKHFEAKFEYRLQQYANYLNYPYPRWMGEDIEGKTLLVVAEQGLGDTLSFLRFVPTGGVKVILQVQSELVRFVAQMFERYPSVEVGPLVQALPAADYWCAITSLPFARVLTDKEIVNAKAPKVPYTSLAATVPWKTPGKKFHVGVAWAGSTQNDIDRWRSFNIEQVLELCRVPGVQLYGLQVGPRAADIHAAGAQALVKDLSPYIRDVAETASIMRDLDLVVTVESAPRHIAGLLGVECWVPYPYYGSGDFRCGRHRDHPVWDDKTTLFRQGPDGQWGPVFERIVEALKERVG